MDKSNSIFIFLFLNRVWSCGGIYALQNNSLCDVKFYHIFVKLYLFMTLISSKALDSPEGLLANFLHTETILLLLNLLEI